MDPLSAGSIKRKSVGAMDIGFHIVEVLDVVSIILIVKIISIINEVSMNEKLWRAILIGTIVGLVIGLGFNWIKKEIKEHQSPLIERVTFPWER